MEDHRLSTERSGSTGPFVLVVDDEPFVRRVVVGFLERGGYRARAADGGEEALRILREGEEPIDVLLTDVEMPGLDGPDLVRQAREGNPHLRILFMSGARSRGELTQIRPLLQKPFSTGELYRSLEYVLVGTTDPEPGGGKA